MDETGQPGSEPARANGNGTGDGAGPSHPTAWQLAGESNSRLEPNAPRPESPGSRLDVARPNGSVRTAEPSSFASPWGVPLITGPRGRAEPYSRYETLAPVSPAVPASSAPRPQQPDPYDFDADGTDSSRGDLRPVAGEGGSEDWPAPWIPAERRPLPIEERIPVDEADDRPESYERSRHSAYEQQTPYEQGPYDDGSPYGGRYPQPPRYEPRYQSPAPRAHALDDLPALAQATAASQAARAADQATAASQAAQAADRATAAEPERAGLDQSPPFGQPRTRPISAPPAGHGAHAAPVAPDEPPPYGPPAAYGEPSPYRPPASYGPPGHVAPPPTPAARYQPPSVSAALRPPPDVLRPVTPPPVAPSPVAPLPVAPPPVAPPPVAPPPVASATVAPASAVGSRAVQPVQPGPPPPPAPQQSPAPGFAPPPAPQQSLAPGFAPPPAPRESPAPGFAPPPAPRESFAPGLAPRQAPRESLARESRPREPEPRYGPFGPSGAFLLAGPPPTAAEALGRPEPGRPEPGRPDKPSPAAANPPSAAGSAPLTARPAPAGTPPATGVGRASLPPRQEYPDESRRENAGPAPSPFLAAGGPDADAADAGPGAGVDDIAHVAAQASASAQAAQAALNAARAAHARAAQDDVTAVEAAYAAAVDAGGELSEYSPQEDTEFRQPRLVPGGALPQRVPAAPDVPDVPDDEPEYDYVEQEPAPTPLASPELARIATHLRSDEDLEQEAPGRPDGFDMDAVLGAVREVAGVRDAQLRPNPNGVHTLRLDLADGADGARVSREVARLLKQRMGLAAEPRRPAAVPAQSTGPASSAGRAQPEPDLAGDEDPRRSTGPSQDPQDQTPGQGQGQAPGLDPTQPHPNQPHPNQPHPNQPHPNQPHDAMPVAGASPAPRIPIPASAAENLGGPAAANAGPGRGAEDRNREPQRRHAVAGLRGRGSADNRSGYLTGEHAQAAPPLRRAAGSGEGSRVVLDQVQVNTLGLDATVTVRLLSGSGPAEGRASGPAVDGYVLRLAAVAAAAAIDQLLSTVDSWEQQRGRCFVEHAAVLPLGSCEVAVVVVLLVCGGWVEQLSGAALVNGDPRQAVVRATLAAVNRRLDGLLG